MKGKRCSREKRVVRLAVAITIIVSLILSLMGVLTSPAPAVRAISDSDEWCGECEEWDNDGNCIKRKYHQSENPTNCYCCSDTCGWGNCVWWALYKRPDIIDAGWGSVEPDWDNRPYGWDSYADQAGYPVSAIPQTESVVVLKPGAQGAGSLGHVAYVENVLDNPPTDRSGFAVSEMECGRERVVENPNYRGDGGNGIHFIYNPNINPPEIDASWFDNIWQALGSSIVLEWETISVTNVQYRIKIVGWKYLGPGGDPPYPAEDYGPMETFVDEWLPEGQVSYEKNDLPLGLYAWGVKARWTINGRESEDWGAHADFFVVDAGCFESQAQGGLWATLDGDYCPDPEPTPPVPGPTQTPTPTPTATATTEPTNTPTSEPTFFITGQVTGPAGSSEPISGVQVCAGGAGGYCVQTDSGGHYRIEGLAVGTHTVTPSKEGLSFIPSSKDVTGPPDQESVNFVGVAAGERFAVSGFVTGPGGSSSPISGVKVCVTGHEPCAWTDGTGNYRIEDIPSGLQVVAPSKDHYTFLPPSKGVSGPPDVERIDFVGVPSDCCYTVWGYVSGPGGGSETIPGIRVDIRGHGSSYTDHNGKYIIGGLESGHYKVLPYDDGYDFGPVCKWVDVGPDQGHVNFLALPTVLHQGVTLYEHADYQGVHETFEESVPNLANTCFGDERASSLKIVGPYTAILYEGINYQGDSETFTADDSQLGDNTGGVGNDAVSSLRVLTPTPTPTNTPIATPVEETPTPTPCTPLFEVGDFDCDCEITVADIMQVASRWRCWEGEEFYDAIYDFDDDGVITVVDIMVVSAHWGETCEIPRPTATPEPPPTPG